MDGNGHMSGGMHPNPGANLPIRIVTMADDIIDHGALLATALRADGSSAEIDYFPYIPPGRLDRGHARLIEQKLSPRHPDEIVVFAPGLREYYLFGRHVSVHFSGYASWRQTPNLVVLPHPWELAMPEPGSTAWAGRPPLTVGFMGTTYRASRIARLVTRLPGFARRWIIRGGLSRSITRCATLEGLRLPIRFAPTFPRFRSIDAVQDALGRHPTATAKMVDTVGFNRAEANVKTFKDNLLWSTYVLCPRGIENYSFRVYEALRFGRIPVIVDTDMVLPDREMLEQLGIIIAYDDVATIMDVIADDHARHDAAAFAERQRRALAYSAELLDPAWLGPRLRKAIESARAEPSNSSDLST